MSAHALHELDPRTPVLVGVGEDAEFVDDPGYRALSPADLAGAAARGALADATLGAYNARAGRALAAALDVVACVRLFEDSGLEAPTPLGRSTNLPRSVAARIGARPSRAILEIGGGQSPQHLITEFAAEIAAGRAEAVLIAGAEALSSVRQWRDAPPERRPRWQEMPGGKLEDRGPGLEDMTSRDKQAVGLVGAPAAYGLFENARRARLGLSKAQYATAMGELFAPFTRVAAANPLAAVRTERSAAELVTVDPRNRLIAAPYPRFLVARDTVNQGAAVLLTSLGRARERGLPSRRAIFLAGHADAVEQDLLRRPDLASSPASMAALRLALDVAGITADDLATIDLYSCFPIAVTNAADGLRIAYDDPRGLTVTGGLPYFGGPGNNYVTHSIAEMVQRVRAQPGIKGLVTANGNYLTKHSAGIYSTEPPARPFAPADPALLQAELDAIPHPPLVDLAEGHATVESYTVSHDGKGPVNAVVIGRLDDGSRFIANTPPDAALWQAMQTEDFLGRRGRVQHDGQVNRFVPG